MGKIKNIIVAARKNPVDIKFTDICKVCDHYFGKPRQKGSSHRVYKTPWQGDPRVNIQKKDNKAKGYQVKQVLKAIDRLGRGKHGQ